MTSGSHATSIRNSTVRMIARSCEAYAHVVRAVIGKDVCVVEETGLHRRSCDPVKTVRNTMRETRVDVERVPDSATARPAAPGAAGHPDALRDNAATRAIDHTFRANGGGRRPIRRHRLPGQHAAISRFFIPGSATWFAGSCRSRSPPGATRANAPGGTDGWIKGEINAEGHAHQGRRSPRGCRQDPSHGGVAPRQVTAGLDVSGVPLAAEPVTFGGSGKVADACRKLDVTTDAVLRAAREVVRDVHG